MFLEIQVLIIKIITLKFCNNYIKIVTRFIKLKITKCGDKLSGFCDQIEIHFDLNNILHKFWFGNIYYLYNENYLYEKLAKIYFKKLSGWTNWQITLTHDHNTNKMI